MGLAHDWRLLPIDAAWICWQCTANQDDLGAVRQVLQIRTQGFGRAKVPFALHSLVFFFNTLILFELLLIIAWYVFFQSGDSLSALTKAAIELKNARRAFVSVKHIDFMFLRSFYRFIFLIGCLGLYGSNEDVSDSEGSGLADRFGEGRTQSQQRREVT